MENTPAPESLAQALSGLKRQFYENGGWRLIGGFMLLWVYAASLFLLVVAPYELSLVYAARDWPAVPAHVKSVELALPPFHEGQRFWQFTLTRDDTGAELVTADVRPGDLPISILGWSSTTADAQRYAPGLAVNVFVRPDGRKFFLEQGSPLLMQGVITACLALWLWTGRRIWRRRR